VLLPEGLPEGLRREVPRREAVPGVQPGPLMALRSARPVALRRERAAAARPDVPAGLRRADLGEQHRAHLSAAAARKVPAPQAAVEGMAAQRLAEAVVARRLAVLAAVAAAVQQAQEVPPASAAQPTAARGAVVAPDVVAGRQPAAESAGVAARRREAAAGPGAAAEVQPQAAVLDVAGAALPQVAEAARPQAAGLAAVEAERLREAAVLDAAGVRRRVARDAPGVLLLAAAWAGPLCPQAPRLAPIPPAQSAHARGRLRTARP
jgi:hypothetical protein